MNDALEHIVKEELDRLNYDLVELRTSGARGRPLVQLRIDRRDAQSVSVDDCTAASRAIEARLDAQQWADGRYGIEVSSPGVERPLRTAADWRRFVGRRASVSSPVLEGREEVEILAVEGDVGAEVALVRRPRGMEQRLPLAEVKDARLAFHW